MLGTYNYDQSIGRVVPRMGIYSLNKMCKCNFHRTQNAMFTRRKLKRGNNSLKGGDVLALALRRQARHLGLGGQGQICLETFEGLVSLLHTVICLFFTCN